MPVPIPPIQTFKEKLSAEGLIKGIFYTVNITFSGLLSPIVFDENELILCNSATLPNAQLDVAELKYFTRTVKVPGSRQYSPITLSLYNTPSYNTRTKFLSWLNTFNDQESNTRDIFAANIRLPRNYATVVIKSYSEEAWEDPLYPRVVTLEIDPDTGQIVRRVNINPENINNRKPLATYTFTSAFPSSITAVQYSYENETQLQTYDVELQYLEYVFEKNT